MQTPSMTPFFGAQGSPASLEQRKAQLIQRLAGGNSFQGMQSIQGNPLFPQHWSPQIFGNPGAQTPQSDGSPMSVGSNPYHSMPLGQLGTALGSFMSGR